MATKLPIVPLVNKQRMMGTISLARPVGMSRWIKVGPTGTVNFTPTVDTVESKSAETGLNKLIRKFTTGTSAVVEFSDASAWTEFMYTVQFMAAKRYLTQSAVTAQTIELTELVDNYVFDIPVRKGTVTSITNGETGEDLVTLVEGLDYIFSSETRFGEIKKAPVGFGNIAIVTYSAPAITEAEAMLDLDILSATGVRCELMVIGIDPGGNGDPMSMYLPSVEFRPNGAATLGDAANLNVATLQADVYQDESGSYGRLEIRNKIVEA